MTRHKAAVCGAISIAAALVLAACGGGAPSPNGSGKLDGRGPITFATGKDTSGNMQKLVDQWNSAHPSEKVTITELPESADLQLQQLVQNAQTKSDTFTVLNLDVVWTAEFAANRWVVELSQDQFDLQNFLPPTVDTAKYRGKLYAAPVYSDGGLLFYRKDLLDKAGVQPPKTWAELAAACQKVQALPEAAGTSCYAGQFEKYEGLTVNASEAVYSAGGTIVDDNGKPQVNTPQAKAGLDTLVGAFKSGVIPAKAITFKEEESRRAFQDGQLIFHRQWPYQWAKANMTDGSSQVAGKFAVTQIPGLNGPGASTLGGHNFAISAFAKNQATGVDFIKFFTDEKTERSNLQATSQAPTRTSLYDDPALTAQFPYLPLLKQTILNAKPRPKAVRYGDVTSAIQDSIYAALTGQKTTDQALTELQQTLDRLTQQ